MPCAAPTRREKEILNKAKLILKRYLAPSKIILFGSRSKGTAARGADFDLAVDRPRPAAKIERKIEEELEAIAGLYHVDIVYLKSAEKDFGAVIRDTGTVIYGR